MEGCNIDAESLFLDKLNGILLNACWVDTVKTLVGLKAVSQVWETSPAWYIWLQQGHGVYKLQLSQAEARDDAGIHLNGIFTVKCFPHPQDAVFETFSPEERALRTGPLFDHTQTPKFEHLDKLPPEAFNIAVIECDMDADGRYARFTLETMSSLRTVSEEGPPADATHGQPAGFGASTSASRSVPGWRLGRPLFNWLLAAYAFQSRTKPARIRLSRSPGFVTVQASDPAVHYRTSTDIDCYTAAVYFGTPDPVVDDDGDLPEDSVLLLNWDAAASGRTQPARADVARVSRLLTIDALWWDLAEAVYSSHLGSTCGCSGCHDAAHHCGIQDFFHVDNDPSR
jgi:hypothetical protein